MLEFICLLIISLKWKTLMSNANNLKETSDTHINSYACCFFTNSYLCWCEFTNPCSWKLIVKVYWVPPSSDQHHSEWPCPLLLSKRQFLIIHLIRNGVLPYNLDKKWLLSNAKVDHKVMWLMLFSPDLLMEVKSYSISLWRHREPISLTVIFNQEAFCLSQLYCIVISECTLNCWKGVIMWVDFP